MTAFLLALQFLTIIPVRVKKVSNGLIATSLLYFPLIGVFIGLAISGIQLLFAAFGLRQLSIDIISIVALAFISGCMHLDGLSDTTDALLSHKNKEEMLKIMRDSHVGVMGVISIVAVLLLKIALLYSVAIHSKAVALILMCTLSRWALVFSIYLFPYARQEGKAKAYLEGITTKIFVISTIIALICVLIAGKVQGACAMAIAAGTTYFLGVYLKKRIGGITGDTCGATNELIETLVLLTVAVFTKG
jgi:adenosylcobinamide-GDP ribazoletransferase